MNFPILIFGTLHLVSALLAAGILLFIGITLRPSVPTALPEGIIERLLHIAAASAFLCFVSLIPLTMLLCGTMTGSPPAGSSLARINISMLCEILITTTFGKIMIFRFCTALLLVVSLYFSRHRAGRGSGRALLLSLGLLLSFGFTSHKLAYQTSLLDLGIASLYLMAVAVWPVGLFPLIVFLQSKIPATITLPVLMRFSRLSIGVVAFLALTGIAHAFMITPKLRLLFAVPYGLLLIFKIFILLILSILTINTHLHLLKQIPADPEVCIKKIRRRVTGEAALALVLLIVASFLALIPPPSSFGR